MESSNVTQFKHSCYNLLRGRPVNLFERENRVFTLQFLLYKYHFFSSCRWERRLRAMIKSNLRGSHGLKSVIIDSRESSVSKLNCVGMDFHIKKQVDVLWDGNGTQWLKTLCIKQSNGSSKCATNKLTYYNDNAFKLQLFACVSRIIWIPGSHGSRVRQRTRKNRVKVGLRPGSSPKTSSKLTGEEVKSHLHPGAWKKSLSELAWQVYQP